MEAVWKASADFYSCSVLGWSVGKTVFSDPGNYTLGILRFQGAFLIWQGSRRTMCRCPIWLPLRTEGFCLQDYLLAPPPLPLPPLPSPPPHLFLLLHHLLHLLHLSFLIHLFLLLILNIPETDQCSGLLSDCISQGSLEYRSYRMNPPYIFNL